MAHNLAPLREYSTHEPRRNFMEGGGIQYTGTKPEPVENTQVAGIGPRLRRTANHQSERVPQSIQSHLLYD